MKKQQYITTTFSTLVFIVVHLSAVVTHFSATRFIPPLRTGVTNIPLRVLYVAGYVVTQLHILYHAIKLRASVPYTITGSSLFS